MHILFSSQLWHCNIFLALATVCIILDIHYLVQKYPPTSHTLKNHSSQNSKFRLKNVELCRQEDIFSKCASIAFFSVNSLGYQKFLVFKFATQAPAGSSWTCWTTQQAELYSSGVFMLFQGWGCRCPIAGYWCPSPLSPVPSLHPPCLSPQLVFTLCCLLAASPPITEEEVEAKPSKTIFLLYFSLAMQIFVAAKSSKEISSLNL